ncbi:MAG: zinc-ribbon domain-containing protein [candidate division Zixibacteria bacterium]|nr:zinc-ribbon domain-containing protein [candidate division Zixibacteria bacterium]
MRCSQCGAKLSQGERFCPACGGRTSLARHCLWHGYNRRCLGNRHCGRT